MSDRTQLLLVLWAVVLLELVSPIPAFLTLGALWVLLARPPWLPRLVARLYDAPAGAGSSGAGDAR